MRSSKIIVTLLYCLALLGPAMAAPPTQNISTMTSSEIETLQRRLADAKCYDGAIDGKASGPLYSAISACPDQQPFLRIETGMHVAAIRSLGVDAQCTSMATSSDDKTVRVWSLPDGRLKQILRWPIAAGNGGKAYAVGMSPDGKYVAVSGWDARYDTTGRHSIVVFDTASGAVVQRVDGLEETVKRLLFSPDGRWLAATLGSGWGLRLVDTSTWNIVASYDRFGGDDYGVAFGPDGRVYTVSYDARVRRYGPGPEFRPEREVTVRSGRHPYSVSVDPQNQRVAVGFEDRAAIDLFDTNLAYKGAAKTGFARYSNISVVSWRADGQAFLAGGGYSVNNTRPVMLFDRSGRFLHYGANAPALDTILDIKPCGSGFAMAAYGPVFAQLDAQGTPILATTGVSADMRDKREQAFLVSDDTTRVRFGLDDAARRPVVFDLKAGTFEDATSDTSGLHPAITEGLPVANWINTLDPTFAGQPIKLEINDEFSRDIAIRPQMDGFALGADYRVRGFDRSAALLWKDPLPGIAWGTNFSADGQILVVAYGDGTIRWHRWSDGQELLALFVNSKTKAWVVWTPSGYYMASPGAEDMIGWHVNRGWEQAADFFPASRFRDKFNRPDIVRLVLSTLDESAAVAQANQASHRHSDEAPIIDNLPPVINIVSPADGSRVEPGPVEISYKARSPSGGKVDRVEVFVDGAKVQTRGLSREGVGAKPAADGTGTIMVQMPQHNALISVVAYENGRASDAVRVQLDAAATTGEDRSLGATEPALKPSLYALLVGVSKYSNNSFDLSFPDKDAQDFAAALQSQKGKLYKDVQVKVLTDAEATSTAVKDGLLWLQSQTTSRDLAIVFAAGHGVTDAKGRFWFLTADADPKRLLTTAVSRDDFSEVLFDLPGKKLLFLDACHSGAALNAGARGVEQTDVGSALNDFTQAEGGVVAYAASTGKEFSFERDEWHHGAFTKALIEALGQGKADLLHNGTITTSTLDAYLEDRVKQLTDGQQHPEMTRPKTIPDFPIALSR